jgi:hypothetical protein
LTKGRLAKLKLDVLKKGAHVFDIDPTRDYMKPGNSPPEQAFMVASCSLDFLIHLSQVAFPAVGRRTRKRGGKWVMQALLFHGGAGMELLAHASPALMVAMDGRLSADQPAESVIGADHHLRFQKAVESFYPLGLDRRKFLENCLAEFRVMETHEPRGPVVEGTQSANEYSQALLRGENPDDDPELVSMQREYARDFFIDRATYDAVTNALEPADVKIMLDDFARFVTLDDPKAALKLRARALAGWSEGLKPYLEYALLDSKSERPEAAQAANPQ